MKIDVSTIEGYADMTPEQKVAALEAAETPDPDYSGYVSKDIYDKTASELAAKKRELRQKMTDDEAAKEKEKEERERVEKEYADLKRKTAISENKAQLIAMGYDEKLAEETAEAIVDGDTAKVLANQKKNLDAYGKKVRTEALKDTPKPAGGDGDGNTMTLAKLREMSLQDRFEFSKNHPEEYQNLYEGGTE
nr:MAG TPA: protein of unknown function (DUF5446) [Caudoviricetes sp.]